MNNNNNDSKLAIQLDHLPITLRSYWLLVSLEGFFVLTFLLSIPSGSAISSLAGLSTERWLMIIAIGLVSSIFLGLVLFSLVLPNWLDRFSVLFRKVISRRYITAGLYVFSFIAIVGGMQFIFLSFEVTEPYTQAYMVRLAPLVVWAVIVGVQTMIFLPLTVGRFNLSNLNVTIQRFLPLIIIYIVMAFLWGFIWLTGMGLDPSDAGTGWNALGTPVLGWQVIVSWLLSMIVMVIGMLMVSKKGRISKLWRSVRVDMLISLLIWMAAFFTWSAIPLTPSWFVEPPRQPNLEFYPNSDATIYDVPAQSLLAGEGYQIHGTPLTIRPLYVFFLSVIHRLGGLGYEEVINYQIAVLALLPVGLYWITRNLQHRITAILVASLVVMREANAIALNTHITNSNAKLLMSDLPTTLGVVGFTLIVIYWYQHKQRDLWLPIIGGGVLGMTMLIRPELGVLMPVAIAAAYLVFRRQGRYWIASSAALIVGVLLMTSPWLVRNYQQLGVATLHNPELRTRLLIQRYIEASDDAAPPAPTPQQAPEVVPTPQLQPSEDLGTVSNFIIENPGEVSVFVINHFLNNLVQTVLYLPGTSRFMNHFIEYTGHREFPQLIEDCCGLVSYVRWLPYWKSWDGSIPGHALAPIMWSLIMVGIGIHTSWENKKWVGIIPVVFAVTHAGINAVARNSGGRYVLPVDWIGLFYYSIGLIQVTLWTFAFVRNQQMKSIVLGKSKPEVTVPLRKLKDFHFHWWDLVICVGLLLFGLSIPLAERVIPEIYTPTLLEARLDTLIGADNPLLPNEMIEPVTALLASGGDVWQGRALYPRFYNEGAGASGSSWKGLTPKDYPRLGFILIGDSNHSVEFPFESPPKPFPNASDVVIFGCYYQQSIHAWAIALFDQQGNLEAKFLRDPLPDHHICPTP